MNKLLEVSHDWFAIGVLVIAVSMARILLEIWVLNSPMEDTVMLMFYLPMIIFGAMLDVIAKQNAATTLVSRQVFD